MVAVNGMNVTVVVDGSEYFTHTYEARVDADGWVYGINDGMIGLGSDNSRGTFDNLSVQVLPPEYTLEVTEDFEDSLVEFLTIPVEGTWQMVSGAYQGTPEFSGRAISLIDLGTTDSLQANSVLDIDAIINSEATSGIVFDYYNAEDFKYAGLSANSDQLIIGHYVDGKWFVDAASELNIDDATDYQLALSLKGTTVDVSLKEEGADNWQAIVGYVFNAVTVDGQFGLLAKDGIASFDSVTVKTDDPAFRDVAEALMAANASVDSSAASLADDMLAPIVSEAIARWRESGLVDADTLQRFQQLTFNVTDLDGLMLARTDNNNVQIDSDAAGHGWFVDATPADDAEFASSGSSTMFATAESDAIDNMDLLSAVMHELGHVAGYEHTDQGIMDSELSAGERLAFDIDSGTDLVFDEASGELAAAKPTDGSWHNDPLIKIDPSKWHKVGHKWDPEGDDEWMIEL